MLKVWVFELVSGLIIWNSEYAVYWFFLFTSIVQSMYSVFTPIPSEKWPGWYTCRKAGKGKKHARLVDLLIKPPWKAEPALLIVLTWQTLSHFASLAGQVSLKSVCISYSLLVALKTFGTKAYFFVVAVEKQNCIYGTCLSLKF